MRSLFCLLLLIVLSGCTLNWMQWLPPQLVGEVQLVGNAERGRDLFQNGMGAAPPCSSCHALVSGGFSLGPALQGISTRAGIQVEGLTAEFYLHQSILEPEAYITPGYRSIMYPLYADHLDEQAVQDLIAYLLTL
jgi:mono/diheme cytochrome c family protein